MAAKRYRHPKLKDGELRVYYGKLPHDNPDMIFAWQGDATMKRDSVLLYQRFSCREPDPKESPLYSKMLPSFIEELEARGYDKTTLRFSIMKKEA